jgi:hypothetical protein
MWTARRDEAHRQNRDIADCCRKFRSVHKRLTIHPTLECLLREDIAMPEMPEGRTGHDNDQEGRRLWIRSDVMSLQHAEVTVYPWKEPPELKARTINRVRTFLKAHQPVTAAR